MPSPPISPRIDTVVRPGRLIIGAFATLEGLLVAFFIVGVFVEHRKGHAWTAGVFALLLAITIAAAKDFAELGVNGAVVFHSRRFGFKRRLLRIDPMGYRSILLLTPIPIRLIGNIFGHVLLWHYSPRDQRRILDRLAGIG